MTHHVSVLNRTEWWNKKNKLLTKPAAHEPKYPDRFLRWCRSELQEGERGSRIGESIILCWGHGAGVTSQQRIWHETLSHQRDEWGTLISPQQCDKWQASMHWFGLGEEWKRSFKFNQSSYYCSFSWLSLYLYSFLAWSLHSHTHSLVLDSDSFTMTDLFSAIEPEHKYAMPHSWKM